MADGLSITKVRDSGVGCLQLISAIKQEPTNEEAVDVVTQLQDSTGPIPTTNFRPPSRRQQTPDNTAGPDPRAVISLNMSDSMHTNNNQLAHLPTFSRGPILSCFSIGSAISSSSIGPHNATPISSNFPFNGFHPSTPPPQRAPIRHPFAMTPATVSCIRAQPATSTPHLATLTQNHTVLHHPVLIAPQTMPGQRTSLTSAGNNNNLATNTLTINPSLHTWLNQSTVTADTVLLNAVSGVRPPSAPTVPVLIRQLPNERPIQPAPASHTHHQLYPMIFPRPTPTRMITQSSVGRNSEVVVSMSSAPHRSQPQKSTTPSTCETITVDSTPDPDTSTNMLWGRALHLPRGDTVFHGLGELRFSSTETVKRRIRAATVSSQSLLLQLPNSSLDFDRPFGTHANNWLNSTSSVSGSREGFHVCLCCQQSFTSQTLYEYHMLRPVARIVYRCQLCANRSSSESNDTPPTLTAATDQADVSHTDVEVTCTTSESAATTTKGPSRTKSPYCHQLSGGIIKAVNRCALHSHFAYAHATQDPSSWTLQPSRMSIWPMADSTWETGFAVSGQFAQNAVATAPSVLGVDAAALASMTTTMTAPDQQTTATDGIVEASKDSVTIEDDPLDLIDGNETDCSIAYRPGMELNEIWRDFERALHQCISRQDPLFLSSYPYDVDLSPPLLLSTALPTTSDTSHPIRSGSFAFTLERSNRLAHLDHIPLPYADSPLSQAILHASSGDVWHSHLLLTDWYQRTRSSWVSTINAMPEDPIVIEEEEEEEEEGDGIPVTHPSPAQPSPLPRVTKVEDDEGHTFCPPPPAPDAVQLANAVRIVQSLPFISATAGLNFSVDAKSNVSERSCTPASTDSAHPPPSQTPTTPNSSSGKPEMNNNNNNNANPPKLSIVSNCVDAPPPSETQQLPSNYAVNASICRSDSQGLLRCLLCNFRTNDAGQLAAHLTGNPVTMSARCALCSQSVCIKQPDLCAVKAHLLLHLGYFLMCPQCGFTPPAHLPPDAMELCLRVHLRFICHHFNLLQVFVCTLCTGRGKAYNNLPHLIQHVFDVHANRTLSCLWCARQDSDNQTPGHVTRVDAPGPAVSKVTAVESISEASVAKDTKRTSGQVNGLSNQQMTPLRPSKSTSAYPFTNTKDLIVHLQSAHRHILAVPPPTPTISGTGVSGLSTSTGTVTTTATGSRPTSRSSVPPAVSLQQPPASSTPPAAVTVPCPPNSTTSTAISEMPTASVNGQPQQPQNSTIGAAEKPPTSLVNLIPSVDFTCLYQCPQCTESFERRDVFVQHVRNVHYSGHPGMYCFRCFGACKRLSFGRDEFRQHLASCEYAKNTNAATFSVRRQRNRSNFPDDSTATTTTPISARKARHLSGSVPRTQQHAPAVDDVPSGLCFCAYCGIGSRRIAGSHRNATLESVPFETQQMDLPEDGLAVDDPDTLPVVAPLIATSTSITTQSSTATTAAAGNGPPSTTVTTTDPASYQSYYFSNLYKLHEHESVCHVTQNRSAIGCPWCEVRLSCHSTLELKRTLEHMRMHARDHAYALWYEKRCEKWEKNAKDLLHCFCGAALLDCPLAILSHASAHLLAAGPLSSTCLTALGLVGPEGMTSTKRSASMTTTPASFLNPSPSAVLGAHRSDVSRGMQRPGPGAHVPCSVEVYRHLRFADVPALDHYLEQAFSVRQPFVCPTCSQIVSTRWALTEHAFAEHWGQLCYICCLVKVNPVSKTKATEAVKELTEPHESPLSETTSSVADTSGKCGSPTPIPIERAASIDALPKIPPTPPTPAAVPPKLSSPKGSVRENLWAHCYECMLQRTRQIRLAESRVLDQSIVASATATTTVDSADRFPEDGCTVGTPVTDADSYQDNLPPLCIDINSTAMSHQTDLDHVSGADPSPSRQFLSGAEGDNDDGDVECDGPIRSPVRNSASLKRRRKRYRIPSDTDDGGGGGGGGGGDDSGDVMDSTTVRRARLSVASTLVDGSPTLHRRRQQQQHHSIPSDVGAEPRTTSLPSSEAPTATMVVDGRVQGTSNKSRRISSDPLSTHPSESANALEESGCFICVLCGESQTQDSWEEHTLSHRSAEMPWNGVQLSEPQRIMLGRHPQKVYKCYMCDCRFVTRYGCQRHMTGRHKLPKSRICWDVMTETIDTPSISSNTRTRRPSSGPRVRTTSGGGGGGSNHSASRLSIDSPATASTNPESARSIGSIDDRSTPPMLLDSTASASAAQDASSNSSMFYCTICQIAFMSARSLAMHRAAAHSSSSEIV